MTPIFPAAWNLLGRCWPTAALVCWLPLVKWGFPGGGPRTALFYGGGLLLSLVAVWHGGLRHGGLRHCGLRHRGLRHRGGWPRVRPLFRAPGAGLAAAVAGFAALMAISALLLSFSWPRTLLPPPLPELIALFDPRPVYASLSGGGHGFPAGTAFGWAAGAIGWAAGAIAEEWIFRVALLWRWVATEKNAGKPAGAPARNPARNPGPRRADTLPLMGIKLVMVSAYFAALH
ncbi:MAG: hypothetical protein V3S64_01020, partial [bacterium]